ncbi:MAG: insulinase family protein [Spirochaetales bacterium]|nr:insulinase family protein [Spirochaetales bacterium]MCF7938848.1 insulinase family protein [Spirochaetales bacterium]
MIAERRLDNGAKVILDTVSCTDIVSIGFWFVNGSRDEAPGYYGSAHLLEHILFKGTRNRTAFEIAADIERVGGILNAFTEKEVTCYYCIVPKKNISVAIDVLADMFTAPLFPKDDFEREKQVIANEIASVEDSPEEYSYDEYLSLLWDGHPLARKITGEEEEVLSLTVDRLEYYYRHACSSDQLVVTLAGNLEFDDFFPDLRKKLTQLPGNNKFPSANSPLLSGREAPDSRVFCEHQGGAFQQVHIHAGRPMSLSDDISEYYKILLLSTAFGETMSSRLFQHIREEQGLCYSISSMRSFFTDAGLFSVYAVTSPALFIQLREHLTEEFSRLKTNGFTNREIEDARLNLQGSIIMAREDMETRMKRIFRHELFAGRPIDFDEAVNILNSITYHDIEDLINQSFDCSEFSFLAYGNEEAAAIAKEPLSF